MNASLVTQLRKSPAVRDALKKEARRLLVFVALYVATIVVNRYLREQPVLDGVLSAVIGAVAVFAMWLVAALRTIRAVLREHAVLER